MDLNKEFIEWFNKNKNKNNYRKIFQEYFPNKSKCRICNDVIYYYDSTFKISKKNKVIELNHKSCDTSKFLDKIYYLSICEDCLSEKYPEYQSKNKSRVFNQMNYITEYAFNIDHSISLNWIKEKYAITESNLIKKWGEEVGRKKWESYCKKQSETNTFEYKREKYGWTKEKFDDYNKSRSVTLENLVKRHGEEKGLNMWKEYCDKQKYSTTIEYFLEKHGEERGREIYENFCKKRMFEFGYSNISQELFKKLDENLKEKTQYYLKGGEKIFFYKDKSGVFEYYLDFYISDMKIGIEFNGDMWHANPRKYKSNDIPFPFRKKWSAKDIWEKDRIKNEFLRTKLNKLIIIWEYDLNRDGIDKTVDKIIKEIYE